jgi:uncharacterized OsmC-like protein
MPYLTVKHRGPHRFDVNVEGHHLAVDEGVAAGGHDAGPTSAALLAASLASCAAAHAEAFLATHGFPTAGLVVTCHYQLSADQPARVASLDVSLCTAALLETRDRLAMLKAVEECMVGNTLRTPPLIHIMIAAPEGVN